MDIIKRHLAERNVCCDEPPRASAPSISREPQKRSHKHSQPPPSTTISTEGDSEALYDCIVTSSAVQDSRNEVFGSTCHRIKRAQRCPTQFRPTPALQHWTSCRRGLAQLSHLCRPKARPLLQHLEMDAVRFAPCGRERRITSLLSIVREHTGRSQPRASHLCPARTLLYPTAPEACGLEYQHVAWSYRLPWRTAAGRQNNTGCC